MHSLSDKLEAFHTNALHDRARIVALERTSVHTRQLVDLVAQHNEDRAHIEALEKTIKALKSEFKFIRQGPIPFAIVGVLDVHCQYYSRELFLRHKPPHSQISLNQRHLLGHLSNLILIIQTLK